MPERGSTTIRVPARTRDRLNVIARRRGEPAGEVIAKLVDAADDEWLLAESEIAFEALANDSEALAAYRAETTNLADGFDSEPPPW